MPFSRLASISAETAKALISKDPENNPGIFNLAGAPSRQALQESGAVVAIFTNAEERKIVRFLPAVKEELSGLKSTGSSLIKPGHIDELEAAIGAETQSGRLQNVSLRELQGMGVQDRDRRIDHDTTDTGYISTLGAGVEYLGSGGFPKPAGLIKREFPNKRFAKD